METHELVDMPEWAPLVLSYARSPVRETLVALLRLDAGMARIVSSVTEPALGQLRMAWWRQEILRERNPDEPMPPDPLLQAIIRHWWVGRTALVELIDGWEHVLFAQDWTDAETGVFSNGRAAAFAMLAKIAGHDEAAEAAGEHGAAWAAAELGLMGHADPAFPQPLPSLPRPLRPLAMIGGLSRRSIRRDNAPLLGDRLSPLVAMRLGIFGA